MSWISTDENWLGNQPRRHKTPANKKQNEIDEALKKQPGVPYFVLKCPKCDSSRCRCYSSNPPIRYHKCNDCGYNFKSVEQDIFS